MAMTKYQTWLSLQNVYFEKGGWDRNRITVNNLEKNKHAEMCKNWGFDESSAINVDILPIK